MLFLAVFCGFLAEYQLEHKIERDRAKELARNLYDELTSDSINAALREQYRIRQENALLEVVKYLKDSSLTNVSKNFTINFIYGPLLRSRAIFEPRTVILEQLKNSGSLRYFKNKELQKLIGDLTVAIQNVNDRQALETQIRLEYLNSILIENYDYDFEIQLRQNRTIDIFTALNKYENSNDSIPFRLKGADKIDRQKAINIMSFYAISAMEATRNVHLKKYIDVNAELLKVLRKEYKIDTK